MTNKNASQAEERLVNVIPPFEADPQSAVLVKPTEGSLYHPAENPQPASVFGPPLCQHRLDAQFSKSVAVRLGVIRPISLNFLRTTSRPTGLAGHRRDGLHQGKKLGDIVTVRPRQTHHQRDAVGVGQDVVFGARFSSIRGIRTRFRPPKTARTEALSTTARDQSIWSPWRSSSSRARWTFSHTPAWCHSWSRRQQVIPEPQPNSCGRYSQGIPVRKTNRMPVSAARLGTGFRPGNRNRRGFGSGSKGSIRFQRASSRIGLAMCVPLKEYGPHVAYRHNLNRTASFC